MNLKHVTCHRRPLSVLCYPPTNHQVALDQQSPMITDTAYQIIVSHSGDSSPKTRINYNIPVNTQNTTEKRHLWAISRISPNGHLQGGNDIQGFCGLIIMVLGFHLGDPHPSRMRDVEEQRPQRRLRQKEWHLKASPPYPQQKQSQYQPVPDPGTDDPGHPLGLWRQHMLSPSLQHS
jgi:hypothetical protein